MVVDKLENLEKYVSLNPLFAQAVEFLKSTEVMGYTPRTDLPEEEYNAEKDITFYKGLAKDYLTITPGMFAIFFPQDGHAPGVTSDGVKKVIVKVRVH